MNCTSQAQPDFYMSSSEYRLSEEPRRCYAIKKSKGQRSDFLLVRVEPPIPAGVVEGYDREIDEVAIQPRHVGVSLFPITRWPVYVHVVLPIAPGVRYQKVIYTEMGELYAESWAELYPTMQAARDKRL